MAKYKSDQRDILFNLLDVLDVTQFEKYGFDESSVKEIVTEYDKFVENEIFPTREKSDEEGVKLESSGVKVPQMLKPLNKNFYEMGWFALGQPEEFGGSPCPSALASLCLSLSTAANTGWSMYPGLTRGAMNVIKAVGDDWAKKIFVEPMMTGRWGGTMNLTESSAGSDVGNLKSTATPIDGKEGWYKIKGSKIFISGGDNDLYENIVHLVLARTPKGEDGTKGLSLFIVPKFKVDEKGEPGDANDVHCSKVEHKMGIHASATCVLNYGDNDNCEGYLLGNEFDGIQNMFIMMNEARLDCGIQGEAQANLAYMMTHQYVHERSQFKTEIIQHPDVKRMMLKMRAMSRGLRALMLYTSNLFDQAESNPQLEQRIGLLTPICKSFGSDKGFEVAVDAVQCHGGYGYCTEYGVEQFVRDIKIASIYEGTNGIQALDFVMRKILKDGGKTIGNLAKEMAMSAEKLPKELEAEKLGFMKALANTQGVLEKFGDAAKGKEMNYIMQHSKDFLDTAAHLVVCWRLLESATIAHSKIAKASSEDEKAFLQSKIDDFKVYAAQFLPHAIANTKTILGQVDDITQYNI